MADDVKDQKLEELKPGPVPTEAESEYHVVINPERDPLARWYVVHTYSGHEQRVAQQL